MSLSAKFYEAAIQVDAILAYPWMRENEIGVFPHKRALALDFPELVLLYGLVCRGRPAPRGGGTHSKQKKSASVNVCIGDPPASPGGGVHHRWKIKKEKKVCRRPPQGGGYTGTDRPSGNTKKK